MLAMLVALLLEGWMPSVGIAQITRSQVNLQFMRAEMLLRQGKDSAALEALDVVIEMAPNYPPPYLRKARILDESYQRTLNPQTLAGAIYQYRKYLTLEIDEQKISDAQTRLSYLENKAGVKHFEELQEHDSQEELAGPDVASAVTSDQEAIRAAEIDRGSQQPSRPASSNKPQPRPTGGQATQPASRPTNDYNFARRYKINSPTIAERQRPASTPPANANSSRGTRTEERNVTGHWVSDMSLDDGREMWNFFFKRTDTGSYIITISDQSGIVGKSHSDIALTQEDRAYMHRVASPDGFRYVIDNQEAEATPNGNQIDFVFAIDEERDHNGLLQKWTKNLLSGISNILPWTDTAESEDTSLESQDEHPTTIEYRFECQILTENVMKCHLSHVRNKVNPNGYMRSRRGPDQTIYLYRTPDDYSYFKPSSSPDYRNDDKMKELFDIVSADAEEYPNRRYPLATLYHYGIGVKRNDAKAVQIMVQSATLADDSRAMAWLVQYYFTAAFDEKKYSPNTRRKYLKSSDYWAQRLQLQDESLWNGLKGDMMMYSHSMGYDANGHLCSSLSSSMSDSIMHYYKIGAMKGDLHSISRLGHLYLWSGKERRNLEVAEMYLKQAADAMSAEAEYDLGQLYLMKQDYAAYLNHTVRASEMGYPKAYQELSEAYLTARGTSHGVDYDFNQANRLKQAAAQAVRDQWIPILHSFDYTVHE